MKFEFSKSLPRATILATIGAAILFFCLFLSATSVARAQWLPATPVADLKLDPNFRAIGSLVYYPYTRFSVASGGESASRTSGLLAAQVGYVPSVSTGNAIQVGGWEWKPSHTELHEFHAQYLANRTFGVQLGVLGSTKVPGTPYDAFVIYNLSTRRGLAREAVRGNVDFQVGAGIYADPTGGETTTGFSGFLVASTDLIKNVSANISYWYIDNRGTANRLGAGLGYRF